MIDLTPVFTGMTAFSFKIFNEHVRAVGLDYRHAFIKVLLVDIIRVKCNICRIIITVPTAK